MESEPNGRGCGRQVRLKCGGRGWGEVSSGFARLLSLLAGDCWNCQKLHRPDPAAGGGGRAPVAYLPLLLTAGGGGVGGFAGELVELGLGLHHHSHPTRREMIDQNTDLSLLSNTHKFEAIP